MKRVFVPALIIASGLLLASCAHDQGDMKAAPQSKQQMSSNAKYQSGYSTKMGKKRSYSY